MHEVGGQTARTISELRRFARRKATQTWAKAVVRLPEPPVGHPSIPPQFPPSPTQVSPKPPTQARTRAQIAPEATKGRPTWGVLKAGFVVWGEAKSILEGLGGTRADPEGILQAGAQTGFSPIGAYREPLGVPGKPSGKPDPLFFGGHGELAPRVLPEHICTFMLRYVAHT